MDEVHEPGSHVETGEIFEATGDRLHTTSTQTVYSPRPAGVWRRAGARTRATPMR